MRLNSVLLALLSVCALLLVYSQHQTRHLHTQYEQERTREKQLAVEYGQLELEQSTWAMHARVERIAVQQMGMQPTDPRSTRQVSMPVDQGPGLR
jgi:cell division protein FtsL